MRARGSRWMTGGVVLLALLLAPIAARAQRPEWKRLYLKGLQLEEQQQYWTAADQFAAAEVLHPGAKRQVDFGPAGRLDYDPYYHRARCLALAGGSPALVRRLAKRSAREGVTPRPALEALRGDVLLHRGGPAGRRPTPFWKEHPPLRSSPPGVEGGRGSGERAAAPALMPTPASPTRVPAPTATSRPALAMVKLGKLPEGVVVTVDGRAYPAGTREILLRPGPHTLSVARGGETVLETKVDLKKGAVLWPVIPPTPTAVTGTAIATPTHAPTPAVLRPASPGGAAAQKTRFGLLVPLLAGLLLLAGLAVVLVLGRRGAKDGAIETTPTRRMTAMERESGHERPGRPGRGTVMAGRTFGSYVIEDRLGSGGMATTYRALRPSDGREVALKVPHEHCLDDESFRQRFLREGRLGSQLHHPNIVRILEAGEEGGTPFLAMELVRGTTLRELLRTAGELPLENALDLVRQVAEALDYAHSKGVIHRDLKPENLMILPDGRLVVMDFGIARIEGGEGLTATSVFVGTPAYAAPEAIGGGPADHRLDLYALGILLLEMLEGGLPFAGSSPLEQLQAHLEGKLPDREELKREVPAEVWRLITGLTARDPADRFPTAEAFLVALREVLRGRETGGDGGS